MWNKIKDMIGINENEYDEDYVEYYPEEEVVNGGYPEAYSEINSETQEKNIHNYQSNRGSFAGKQGVKMTKSNVIGMPGITNGVSEVVVSLEFECNEPRRSTKSSRFCCWRYLCHGWSSRKSWRKHFSLYSQLRQS